MTARSEAIAAKDYVRRLEAEHAAALSARWRTAWDQLQPEYEALLGDILAGGADDTGWVSPRVLRASRLEQALAHTRDLITALVEDGIPEADEYALPIAQAAVDGASRALTAQLPPEAAGVVVGWDRLDTKQLDAIFERTTQQITVRSWPLPERVTEVMKQELTRGVVVGANPRTAARSMTKRAQWRFYGGRNRALNIARTEMLDAARAASRAADRANRDVLAGWQWMCSMDRIVCASCLVMHGTFHGVDDPGPLDHPSGRCTRVPVAKGWGELGITGLDGNMEFVIDPNEGETWFNNLSEDSQHKIMGGPRLKAYQNGEVAWRDLAVRKENTNWRPSYTPIPVNSLPGSTPKRTRS